MNVIIYEKEMIEILDSYIKDKYSLEKHDSFIIFEDDENLKGLHYYFSEKENKK